MSSKPHLGSPDKLTYIAVIDAENGTLPMQWSQHGSYTINWQGDILVVCYEGAWNDIAAANLHRDALTLWQARANKPWCMLSDARQWAGATPECLDVWWQFFDDAVQHGMIAVSDIMPTNFHAQMVSPLAERAAKLVHYQRSFSVDEAQSWLQSKLAAQP